MSHLPYVYILQTKSNKELAAFLFNDFLLLTTSNRSLNNATHSLFDLTGHVQYKMYKTVSNHQSLTYYTHLTGLMKVIALWPFFGLRWILFKYKYQYGKTYVCEC